MVRDDEQVQGFEDLHPGFVLIDYENVGLPFFEVTLDVMALKRSELAVVDEYVLRLASIGLRKAEEIEGLLGLEEVIVRRSILALLQADLIDYPPGATGREIRLTASGKAALEQRVQDVPHRTEIRIGFDRLLWELSPRWMNDWASPRRFKDLGMRLVLPKAKGRPELEDMDLVALNRELAQLPSTRRTEQTDVDVIQLLTFGTRTKYLPAMMLVFVADDQSAIRVSFIIDGRHSPEHDRAFEDSNGLKRLGIELDDHASADVVHIDLPPELANRGVSRSELDKLDKRLRETTQALTSAVAEADLALVAGDAQRPKSSTRDRLRDREDEVERLRSELETLRAHRAALPIRSISTYEHPTLFEEALEVTTKRLLIISPWIRRAVVNDAFVAALRRLSNRGVVVHIGYGIKRADVQGHDRDALDRLLKYGREYKKVTLTELGDTHAKILIWDDEMVVTSFNWLSFEGDQRRTFRQEEGTLIRDKAYVDAEYERHRDRITSS